MLLDNHLIETLIFKKTDKTQRYTQDSPVYPSVWLDYYKNRSQKNNYRSDLILTPHKKSSAAELFQYICTYPVKEGSGSDLMIREIASNGETAVAKLTLDELVTIALPMTNWWQKNLSSGKRNNEDKNWFIHLVGALQYSIINQDEKKDLKMEEWTRLFEQTYKKKYGDIISNENRPPVSIWSISRNRDAIVSIERSVPATKADASRRLFDIDGTDIVWAVMDSGIDARHRGFCKVDPSTGRLYDVSMGEKEDPFSNHTRIAATYDFTNFRQILTEIYMGSYKNRKKGLKEVIRISSNKNDKELDEYEIDKYFNDINYGLQHGRQLDWSVIAPLLRIPHNEDEYQKPKHPHGTHVAGIIGADMKSGNNSGSLVGMCPGIELYDIRVLNEDGVGQEFNILAAIQFIRWLNTQKDMQTIHGVNMSFSMIHDVASYACGQTPVCLACERLVAEGTVVVAAAGNLGQSLYMGPDGSTTQGFRMVNITDPGNAEMVITVGATHRNKPHIYGVSYFSSKGPTGDGRLKPDLVAPGEKIISLSIDDGDARMDGTSMAAPHVSGAAALILAKHRELIGKPEKIKKILCNTATDLGREKYFQGCGMVDVLRAIQSV